MRNRCVALWLLGLSAGVLAPAPTVAQQRLARVPAGPQYEAHGTEAVLLGSNWRVLWTTPVTVPVLDLGGYAGGLKPVRRGGRQSETLHFEGADGRRYIFRSLDKFLNKEALPPDLRHTITGDIIQDQVSALFPGGSVMVAPLALAVGLLHPTTELVVMPDDARLGEFRSIFRGMIGQIEENPNEGENDTPGFGGSRKIVDPDRMLELLDESPQHRLQSREYLAARLIDFMIADTDRGGDQWKFARFPAADGYSYRPIPRDHDFAFMVGDGWIHPVATRIYPKMTYFGPKFESLSTLTFMTADMDRRLLADVPRATWDSVVAALQSQLNDAVLLAAVDRMPAEYEPHAATRVLMDLRARRKRLPEVAAELYAMVAAYADVHATAEAERAEIDHLGDGGVDVRLYRGAPVVAMANGGARAAAAGNDGAPILAMTPYFSRRFLPQETREVRLYLHGGDDHVTVRGTRTGDIVVRVIGGPGADVLIDASSAQPGAARTNFYADERDHLDPGQARVATKPFLDPPPGRPLDLQVDSAALLAAAGAREARENDVEAKVTGERYRDWGSKFGIAPTIGLYSGAGVVVGGGPTYTRYGFRREPYELRAQLRALVGLRNGRVGLEFESDYHPENSNRGLSLAAHASQLEYVRYYGYGNDSPPATVDPRVGRDELMVRPAVYWKVPAMRFEVGPVMKYGRPNYEKSSPLDLIEPFGTEAVGQLGAAAELRLDRGETTAALPRGVIFQAGGAGYPAVWDVSDPFLEAHALVRAYIPVPGLDGPFAALRAGGQKVFGTFPVHEAAFIGGRTTLRGFRTDRFSGDASLYGGAELHVPVGQLELLSRGRLGAFGLLDAGRVFFDGASPGGWHTAVGGGLTFTTLGHTGSLAYAHGEIGRFYIELGLPF